jgi:hypothetical protein
MFVRENSEIYTYVELEYIMIYGRNIQYYLESHMVLVFIQISLDAPVKETSQHVLMFLKLEVVTIKDGGLHYWI